MQTSLKTLLWFYHLFVVSTTSAADVERLRLPYGVTRHGAWLESAVHPSLLDAGSPSTRVLVIAGAETNAESRRATAALMEKLRVAAKAWRIQFPETTLSFIAAPYPDGLSTQVVFPPTGKAYDDLAAVEALYLWRWIGMLAPDVVVEIRAGENTGWTIPEAERARWADASFVGLARADRENASASAAQDLTTALVSQAPCAVGTVPALALSATSEGDFVPLLEALHSRPVRSAARGELLRRRDRSPIEVAQELARTYGQRLDEVSYIPALALIARLRLGELTGETSHRLEVERIVKPYHSGEKVSLPQGSNGSQQAGHLLFGELADRAKDTRYIELLRQATEVGFDPQGQMLEAMPAHAEMSDAVFLGTPLLALTARLTGEANYRELALRHLRFMTKLNQRPDGLHRHSPVAPDQTAWGRGNGFVALGLAFTLSELPGGSASFDEVLALYRNHLDAMRPHQDALGLWHQVIDHPESYREFTVTCMTTLAIARGLRRGWLERAIYEPAVRRAWQAIKQRTGPDGHLFDVCAGTGKMKSLREYLDRPALLGRDDRGGAMVFLLCTELAFAERERALSLE